MSKIIGIYKIINKINNKYYVGGSINIKERWISHKCYLNKKKHKNKHLESAWHKYGKHNFEFLIIETLLETITIKELLNVEQKYLDIAKNEQDKCYNKIFIAGGGKIWNTERHPSYGKKFSESHRQKMGESRKQLFIDDPEYADNLIKRLNSYSQKKKDLNIYEFINIDSGEKFTGFRRDFQIKYNLSSRNLCHLINGKCKSLNHWALTKNTEITETGKIILINNNSSKIILLNDKKQVIKTFSHINVAADFLGVKACSISSAYLRKHKCKGFHIERG